VSTVLAAQRTGIEIRSIRCAIRFGHGVVETKSCEILLSGKRV